MLVAQDMGPLPIAPVAGQVVSSALSSDFSFWNLLVSADWVVQSVMLGLIGVSLWSWAIIFSKILTLYRFNRLANRFEAVFWSGSSLEALYSRLGKNPKEPFSHVFSAAMQEWRRGLQLGQRDMALRRIERVLAVVVARQMDGVEKSIGFLASVGSVSPFVGLFGTVWGIMNSFQAIALSKNASLTVVAPAIAEALFATALGLVAAIPAVLAYNKLSHELDRYGNRLETFGQELIFLLQGDKKF